MARKKYEFSREAMSKRRRGF